ncbi:MAG TPA: hypothetical protein VFW16_14080 [Streptosporangiaceae bacterium]|nr:hypothetical protein [Streptosporangiaceae bacterium]
MTQHDAGANDPASGSFRDASRDGHEASQRGPAARNSEPDEPARLLSDLGRLRMQARSIRHAYWLPLVLFGLVIAASSPFYLATLPSPFGGVIWTGTGTFAAFSGMLSGNATGLTIYWLVTIGAGLYVTWLWYRRHGRRVGLMTPARGFVIAGVVVGVLVIVLPTLQVLPGDLVVRGTLPFLIIAATLWVLAWAERSRALLFVAAVFTGTALLASLYNVENIMYRLGWSASVRFSTLPNILLPALVLLISGGCAFVVQRRGRAAA